MRKLPTALAAALLLVALVAPLAAAGPSQLADPLSGECGGHIDTTCHKCTAHTTNEKTGKTRCTNWQRCTANVLDICTYVGNLLA